MAGPIRSTGQHFIVASTGKANEPLISQCAIELGKAGLWNRNNRTVTSRLCPFPGFNVEYFLWLAYMLNFTFEVRIPQNGSYGKKLNDGSWDGAIGMLIRNEADLSFHPVFMTEERFNVVEYAFEIGDHPLYGFLYKRPPNIDCMFTIFYPLNWSVYTAVCASFLVTFAASVTVAWYTNSAKPRIVLRILCIMVEADPAATKARFRFKVGVILFSWFLVSYTLANAYRSNLTVSAMSQAKNMPIHSVDDAVLLLRSNRLHLVVPKEYLAQFYGVLDILPAVSVEYETWAKLLKNYTPVVSNDSSETAEYLSKEGYAYFGDLRVVMWHFAKSAPSNALSNLDLVFMDTTGGAETSSLAFRKNFPYKTEFRAAMSLLMSETLAWRNVRKYFPAMFRTGKFKYEKDRADGLNHVSLKRREIGRKRQALKLWKLMSLFSIWFIGCGFAWLSFLIEFCLPGFLAIESSNRW